MHDDEDVLAEPIRARLFDALVELRRPAATEELAALVRRHPNSVRVQLQRLAHAGLIDGRRIRMPRGRPRQEWAVHPDAEPRGATPEAHGDLGRWLARALDHGDQLDRVEATGEEIGRELAPERGALEDVLAALGFAPRTEAAGDRRRYVLRNCPYREAVAESPAVICGLHRGITRGLLSQLGGELTDFVARDPFTAGCLIETT